MLGTIIAIVVAILIARIITPYVVKPSQKKIDALLNIERDKRKPRPTRAPQPKRSVHKQTHNG